MVEEEYRKKSIFIREVTMFSRKIYVRSGCFHGRYILFLVLDRLSVGSTFGTIFRLNVRRNMRNYVFDQKIFEQLVLSALSMYKRKYLNNVQCRHYRLYYLEYSFHLPSTMPTCRKVEVLNPPHAQYRVFNMR